MLDAEQKEMLKNEIKKVRLDASDTSQESDASHTSQESLEDIPIERLLEQYIEMSVEIVKEMENRRDPVFLDVLRYAQMHLTREVDRIAHLVVLHEPET